MKLSGGGAVASEKGLDMDRENTGSKNKRIQGRAFCGRELKKRKYPEVGKRTKDEERVSVEVEWEGGTRTWQQVSENHLWGIDDTVWGGLTVTIVMLCGALGWLP